MRIRRYGQRHWSATPEAFNVLEVSVPRVHQLRAKALKDLKKLMEADG
ncbi:MAG: hypothetical protein SXU28_01215 [Pseudomonadota bacterium]|nr:hypothetical protein [Pseudomonadota bacterium]